jgi:hypothetical protein
VNTIDRRAYEGDIVSRLRHWRGLHLAHGGLLFEAAADEIERLRITAEEREAIEGAIVAEHGRGAWQWAATLRKLLERLHT